MKRSKSFRYPPINTQVIEIKSSDIQDVPVTTTALTHFGQTTIVATSACNEPVKRTNSYLNSQRHKSKSLDRIDDGLGAMVDIVVTGSDGKQGFKTRSDSGNVATTTICRTVSNNNRVPKCFSQQTLERNKMFLPTRRSESRNSSETHYYFPRIQEKRSCSSGSFLVRRGHTNAGLYSGQVVIKDEAMKKTEYLASTGSKNSSGKVTDFPSGLY